MDICILYAILKLLVWGAYTFVLLVQRFFYHMRILNCLLFVFCVTIVSYKANMLYTWTPNSFKVYFAANFETFQYSYDLHYSRSTDYFINTHPISYIKSYKDHKGKKKRTLKLMYPLLQMKN